MVDAHPEVGLRPADVLIVCARGSTEPPGGSRLLTPLARSVALAHSGPVTIAELDYPATYESFDPSYPASIDLGASPAVGVSNLVRLLNREAEARPRQRFVLLGWSQGAQVVGDALLPPADRHAGREVPPLTGRAGALVTAVTLFGNPAFTAGEPHNAGDFGPGVNGVTPRRHGVLAGYSSRLRDYCTRDDLAAQATPKGTIEGHVAYFHNDLPTRARAFILERLGGLTAEAASEA